MRLRLINVSPLKWFGLWCLMPLSTIFQLYPLLVDETGLIN